MKRRFGTFAPALVVVLSLFTHLAIAAEAPKPTPSPSPSPTPATGATATMPLATATNPGLQPLDGVQIEAIEIYQNPKTNHIDFGLGVWPVNPYYNAFSLNIGYTYYLNKTYSWEVIDGDYVYTVDKGLSSELADRWAVTPQAINRLQYVISSNLKYVHSYGKFIFLRDYIRYFRSAFLLGPAYLVSTQDGSTLGTVGLNFGWRIETFINNDFSWKLEIRDTYAFGDIGNNLTFIFGTSYGF